MGERFRASLPGLLAGLAVVPMLILKDWLRDQYQWPEFKAFAVSLSVVLIIAGLARLYLRLRKSQKSF